MMAFTADVAPARAAGPHRFVLRRSDFAHRGNTCIDGGWWPRSTELAVEVGELVAEAQAAGCTVLRVLYRIDDWIAPPRREAVASGDIKLSGYHNHARDTITLIDADWKRLDLLVIPVGYDQRDAERALTIAATDGDPGSAAEILVRAHREHGNGSRAAAALERSRRRFAVAEAQATNLAPGHRASDLTHRNYQAAIDELLAARDELAALTSRSGLRRVRRLSLVGASEPK